MNPSPSKRYQPLSSVDTNLLPSSSSGREREREGGDWSKNLPYNNNANGSKQMDSKEKLREWTFPRSTTTTTTTSPQFSSNNNHHNNHHNNSNGNGMGGGNSHLISSVQPIARNGVYIRSPQDNNNNHIVSNINNSSSHTHPIHTVDIDHGTSSSISGVYVSEQHRTSDSKSASSASPSAVAAARRGTGGGGGGPLASIRENASALSSSSNSSTISSPSRSGRYSSKDLRHRPNASLSLINNSSSSNSSNGNASPSYSTMGGGGGGSYRTNGRNLSRTPNDIIRFLYSSVRRRSFQDLLFAFSFFLCFVVFCSAVLGLGRPLDYASSSSAASSSSRSSLKAENGRKLSSSGHDSSVVDVKIPDVFFSSSEHYESSSSSSSSPSWDDSIPADVHQPYGDSSHDVGEDLVKESPDDLSLNDEHVHHDHHDGIHALFKNPHGIEDEHHDVGNLPSVHSHHRQGLEDLLLDDDDDNDDGERGHDLGELHEGDDDSVVLHIVDEDEEEGEEEEEEEEKEENIDVDEEEKQSQSPPPASPPRVPVFKNKVAPHVEERHVAARHLQAQELGEGGIDDVDSSESIELKQQQQLTRVGDDSTADVAYIGGATEDVIEEEGEDGAVVVTEKEEEEEDAEQPPQDEDAIFQRELKALQDERDRWMKNMQQSRPRERARRMKQA